MGTALAGRTHPDMHAATGMFTNTVVLRSRVDSELGFNALLLRARDTMMQAQANQDVPFRSVVEKVVAERSLSHTPLYQVSFALNNAAEGVISHLLTSRGEQYSDNDGVVSTAVKDDLSLQVRVLPDHLELKLTYDIHLFAPQTATRLLAHYLHLLEQMVDAPDVPVGRFGIVGPAEQGELLAQGDNAHPHYPADASLPELFAAQVAATPHAIAVQQAGAQLSYGVLDRWSDALAVKLRAAGVGVGSRVGLCVEGAPEIVAGMLAILKAGAAYVPLDRSYPPHVLDHMIGDAGLRVVLSNACATPWSEADVATIRLDRGVAVDVTPVAPAPETSPARALFPAYVIYTSGSTGKPKGVEVSHRNVVRLVKGADYVALGPDDVFAQMSNHSFDAVTFEVWGALLNGGRLVHVDRDVLLDPVDFGAFLREAKVSALFITVALFNHIAFVAPTALQTVRTVTYGGDAANPEAVRRIFEHGKPARLINIYGPTENTTFSTWFEVRRAEDLPYSLIGGPIANASAHVLDADGNLLPHGVVGELAVGGDGVAIGYAGRPELTAERFVPDPFSARPGARLYRTGDRVRRRGDGAIEYLGRFDNQVKIRGFRIELGEIEAHLAAHPDVLEAAVVVHVTDDGDKRLVAYATVRGDDAVVERVRQDLRQTLPDYKQPFAVIRLERMPLTPNGKVDRARLPAPGRTARKVATSPRDAVEQAIATLWQELLGIDKVSIDDSFFELGGHSLLAITLSVRLRDRLGIEVSTRDVFEHPTLAALADFVRQGPRKPTLPALPPITTASRRERTVPSFVQQRLWFLDRMEGASATYHMPLLLRLDRRYTADAVEAALATIVARHETLRTAFAEVNGMPIAVTAKTLATPLRQVDLGDLAGQTADAVDAACLQVVGDDVMRPFDLAQAPLHRALLVRLPDGDSVLAVTLHHIICDGWSLGNLLRELSLLLAGKAEALPAIEHQYGDYAHWYRTWLEGGALAQQVAHWHERLQGAPPLLSLQPHLPRPAERRHVGRTLEFALDEALVGRLERTAGAKGATLFMAMLAAFKALLAHHSGLDDIVVGMPVANRPHSSLEPLVGFFANTLALRTAVVADESLAQLLGRVRATTLEAYEYQGLPFEHLVDALNPGRSLGHAPLVQVVFGQENFAALDAGAAGGIAPISLRGANRTAKFDLNLSFERQADGAQLYCEYDTDLYADDFVEHLLAQYRALLAVLAEAPETPLSHVALPGDEHDSIARRATGAEAIESALRAIEGIDDVVVVPQDDGRGGWRWIGFVVPTGDDDDTAPLLAAARTALPLHQCPAALVPVPEFPLTHDGAPDRAALAAGVAPATVVHAFEAAATDTEQTIAGIWAELLEHPRVGRHDNFFALGGHSLLASQACARINATFGTDLRIRAFYASQTLQGLADLVDADLGLGRMLEDIDLDSLSDEDAERLLTQLQDRA